MSAVCVFSCVWRADVTPSRYPSSVELTAVPVSMFRSLTLANIPSKVFSSVIEAVKRSEPILKALAVIVPNVGLYVLSNVNVVAVPPTVVAATTSCPMIVVIPSPLMPKPSIYPDTAAEVGIELSEDEKLPAVCRTPVANWSRTKSPI